MDVQTFLVMMSLSRTWNKKHNDYRYALKICGMMKSYTITTFGIAEKIKNYILLLILQT